MSVELPIIKNSPSLEDVSFRSISPNSRHSSRHNRWRFCPETSVIQIQDLSRDRLDRIFISLQLRELLGMQKSFLCNLTMLLLSVQVTMV